MIIAFHVRGWEDYLHWQQNDKQMLRRLNRLIEQVARDPTGSIGKPEPLSFDFSGYWSRRITEEHRLIYKIDGNTLYIVQCRYHY